MFPARSAAESAGSAASTDHDVAVATPSIEDSRPDVEDALDARLSVAARDVDETWLRDRATFGD